MLGGRWLRRPSIKLPPERPVNIADACKTVHQWQELFEPGASGRRVPGNLIEAVAAIKAYLEREKADGEPIGELEVAEYLLMTREGVGARQGSCRLFHAANGCISSLRSDAATMESRSGLSVTAPMGVQSRVSPDHRAGLFWRACA